MMATIVGAYACSHTPQLSQSLDQWESHGERDQNNSLLLGTDYEYHTYAELLATADPALLDTLRPEIWDRKYATAQAAFTELKQRLAASGADVAVVIGDDQGEMFDADGMPMFATFLGTELWGDDHTAPGGGVGTVVRHAVAQDIARFLLERLVDDGFDMTVVSRQPADRPLGHAFAFPRDHMDLSEDVPIVPLFVNTYYPPNVPSAGRAYAIGEAVARAVEAWPSDARVVVIASGGLSHFVVDEQLDRAFLAALADADADALCSFRREQLRSGTSELLNWIVAAGAASKLAPTVLDYIPGYRTPAGTGCGLGFAYWS